MQKNLFYTTAALFMSICLNAQINVGPEIKVVGRSADSFEPGALKRLKKTTTYFIYGERDEDNLEEWETALNRAWKVTPFDFISLKEFLELKSYKGKSFLMKNQNGRIEYRNGQPFGEYYWGYLTLVTLNKEDEFINHCRIELAPDFETMKHISVLMKMEEGEKVQFLYEKAEFYNWHPGLLMAPLGMVSNALQNEEPFNIFKEIDVEPELSKLKTKTVYMPDYVFVNSLGSRASKPYVDVDKLLEKYDFETKIMSSEKLSKLILKSDEDLYLLLYTHSMVDKFINVWNTKTQKLLYKDYKAMSREMKKKDFKKLNKAVEEA